jgi:replicative DNA helicase
MAQLGQHGRKTGGTPMMIEDRIMPQSLEAERCVLGCILLNNTILATHATMLEPDHFFSPGHARVFEAMRILAEQGDRIDPMTLKLYFDDDPAFLGNSPGSFFAACVSTANAMSAGEYVRVVVDCAKRRAMIAAAQTLQNSAYAFDVGSPADEALSQGITTLTTLAALGERPPLTKRTVATEVAAAYLAKPRCHSTGIPLLDDAMGGGLYEGRIYGFAARKKVGKTILAGTISHNLNLAGVRHLFWAGEMSPAELEQRNMARWGKFNSIAFLKRDRPHLHDSMVRYSREIPNNVIYEGAAGSAFEGLKRCVAQGILRHRIRGFIGDYWQLVGGKNPRDSEEYHLRSVAQWSADMARQHGIFVIWTAQVNQDGNTRGGEGLKLACDQYYTLHREKGEDGAWLEMEESRYTTYQDVGSAVTPGIRLNHNGPFFEDFAEPVLPDMLASAHR